MAAGFGIFALCTIIGSLSATVGLEASDDQLKVVKGDNGMFLLHKMNFYRAAQEYENMVVFFDGPGVPLTKYLGIRVARAHDRRRSPTLIYIPECLSHSSRSRPAVIPSSAQIARSATSIARNSYASQRSMRTKSPSGFSTRRRTPMLPGFSESTSPPQ